MPDASERSVRVDVTDHIAVVTFTRPPVNATDRDSFLELTSVFRRLSEDVGVRVVIFQSGGKHFMAGADVKARTTQNWIDADIAELGFTSVTDTGRIVRDALDAVYECSTPVIASVHGVAIGSGFAFASVCDFIVAAEDARFGMNEINIGKLGGASHLIRSVGPYLARRMFFSGELLTARQLERSGMFAAVVPAAERQATAWDLAVKLAEKSTVAMRLAKESLLRVEHLPLQEGYRIEQDYTRRLSRFDDSAEAVRAFLEKREPKWQW